MNKKYGIGSWLAVGVTLLGLQGCGSCDGSKDPSGNPGGDSMHAGDSDLPADTDLGDGIEPGDSAPPLTEYAGENCDTPILALVPDETVTASTRGKADDFVASCNAGTQMGDLVFRFVLTETHDVVVTVTGVDGFDPVVTVLQGTCADGVEIACSDLSGTSESLPLVDLAPGEYTLIVDAATPGLGGGPGDFSITVTLPATPVCPDDEFDRSGFGDDVAHAIPIGPLNVDTEVDGVLLRQCTNDADIFAFEHLGGPLTAALTGAEGSLFVANPVLDNGEPQIANGAVVITEGTLVDILPYNNTLAAGLYLVEIPDVSTDARGTDYALQVHHDCLPDPYDYPLAIWDDRSVDTAAHIFSDLFAGPVSHSVCGEDVDAMLIDNAAGGDIVAVLTDGVQLHARLDKVEADGILTPTAATTLALGGDLQLTLTSADPGTYLLTVTPDEGYTGTQEYAVNVTVPYPTLGCTGAVNLDAATSPVTGSTLGVANRQDPATYFSTRPTCVGNGAPGPDAAFKVTVPANYRLDVSVDADFDAVLYLLDGCPYAGSCLAGADTDATVSSNHETAAFYGWGSPIYVVVDSRASYQRGNFSLAWSLTELTDAPECGDGIVDPFEECDDNQLPPVSGDGCSASCEVEFGYQCSGWSCTAWPLSDGDEGCPAGAVELPMPGRTGISGLIVDATSALATDDLEGSCGGMFGPELVYTFVPTTSTNYLLETVGADTLLYVYEDTCGAAAHELGCNDDSSTSTDGGSSLTFAATVGKTYYVVVDFFGAMPPPVQLTVTRL